MPIISPNEEQVLQAHQSIVSIVERAGDVETAKKQFAYLKGVMQFHGIKAPVLRQLVRANSTLWKSWSASARVELAMRLLRSEFFEQKDWGILVLKTAVGSLDQSWLGSLETEFGALVRGWATCDALSATIFRSLLPNQDLRQRIVGWKDLADPWLQRAAAVSFVNEARKGLYNHEILEVSATTLQNRQRFVQLGAGWALRELSLADRPLVTAFIQNHRQLFISEALRYALEKYPQDERTALTRLGQPRPQVREAQPR